VDGRLYSNKAPGVALASAPGYLITRPFAGPPSAGTLRIVVTAMRLFASSLPVVLMAIAFVAVARHAAVEERRISVVVWILLFATPIFAYGLILFSHALVAAALFGAWALLFVFHSTPGRDIAAGALIGLAVASEYTAVFPAAVLLVALLTTRRGERIARVIVAGLPFAIVLAAYHHAAFGSVLRTPYFYERLPEYRDVARSGFFGLHIPSVRTLSNLLLDPARGLLVFSPVLILAVPGFIAARKQLNVTAWWTLLLVPVSIILIYSGYPNWHGGWNVGPRYIVAAVPFMVLPLVFRKSTAVEMLLAGLSVTAVFLTSIVFPFPPNDFVFPWASLAWPLLSDGLVAPNALHLVLRPLAIAAPFVLLGAALAASLLPRHIPLVAAGALLALVIGAQWPRIADRQLLEIQRRYIAEVYFEQGGAMGPRAPAGLVRRRAMEMQLPPPSWPF
jgi:hypothetical protein